MKTHLKYIILLSFILLFHIHAFAQDTTEINIYINQQVLQTEQNPIIINDRLLVPVRVVAESLGAQVEAVFVEDERLVNISVNDKLISLKIDSPYANDHLDNIVELDAPPVIFNDKTMVPIRFIAESFGATVDWQPDNKAVYISTYELNTINMPDNLVFSFDKYYTSPTFTAYFDELHSVEIGSLITFTGYIQAIRYNSGEDIYEAIISNGNEMVSAGYSSYDSEWFDQESIGKTVRIYGSYRGIGLDGVPSFMLLRYVFADGTSKAVKANGFEIAKAFEGDELLTPLQIKNFLNENAQSYGDIGAAYFTFDVIESNICNYAVIISFDENHPMGNALRFANISDGQRDNVKELLRQYMKVIALALTQKCPSLTLEGYFYDSYWGVDENNIKTQYTMRYASWINDMDVPLLGENYVDGLVIWLKNKDTDWIAVEEK